MAARKVGAPPEAKWPAAAAARAKAPPEEQPKASRDVLALPAVAPLAYDGGEQTIRAFVVDPSDNLGSFERASPSYAARVGQDKPFWATYRLDGLEARLRSTKDEADYR